jgi:hypothetical protein
MAHFAQIENGTVTVKLQPMVYLVIRAAAQANDFISKPTYSGANFLTDASTNNFTVTNNGSVTSNTLNPF